MEIDKIQMYERELEIIDNMNGHEFEKFCAKLLENCEFRDVKVTKGSGDFGIDITARYHNRIYGIQCKRYSKSINLKAVQEVSSGAEFYQCDIAVVMCNGTFTKSAISLAEQIGVRLWGRKELVDWLDECENLRPFQVLCKLKKSDIRYVNSYVRAEPFLMVLPLSALYKEFRACQ